jgi:hypothetical protein
MYCRREGIVLVIVVVLVLDGTGQRMELAIDLLVRSCA